MIITTQPYRDGEINEPFILQWTQIISGQHIGKWAPNEINLNYFPKTFENMEYQIIELDPKAFEIDYTPPTLSTYRVAIPEYWEMLFPNDRFIVGGFDIPLERTDKNVLCVDVAYLEWKAFQNELDKPENAALKRHMEVVWDYIKLQIENNNFV
jgi:hypothetical protein